MKKANQAYTTTELCALFNVKLSTYYYQHPEKAVNPEVIRLMTAIKAVANETDNTYGKRRMRAALKRKAICWDSIRRQV